MVILLLTNIIITAQSYTFGLVRDYNGTGASYEFTFVITPDFTDSAPEFSDIQLSVAISTGNTMTDFTEILTAGFEVSTRFDATYLNGVETGDGTQDLWVFTLSAQTFLVTTPHMSGIPIPVFSFVVENDPTTGTISILENDDPINDDLGTAGFNIDNLVNVDVASAGTTNLYGNTDPAANSYNLMDPLLRVDRVGDISRVALYPNPASNSFVIQGFTEPQEKVRIYDITDGLVKEIENYINDQIDITGLGAGIYFVKLENKRRKTLGFHQGN